MWSVNGGNQQETRKRRLAAVGITVAGLAAWIGAYAAEHSLHHFPPPFPRQGVVNVAARFSR